jgi:hypothetical protein
MIGQRSWGGGIKRPGQIHDDELLDTLDVKEVDPAHEFSVVRGHGATGEVHAMEGPPVCL